LCGGLSHGESLRSEGLGRWLGVLRFSQDVTNDGFGDRLGDPNQPLNLPLAVVVDLRGAVGGGWPRTGGLRRSGVEKDGSFDHGGEIVANKAGMLALLAGRVGDVLRPVRLQGQLPILNLDETSGEPAGRFPSWR
jgi:hypothetical protein